MSTTRFNYTTDALKKHIAKLEKLAKEEIKNNDDGGKIAIAVAALKEAQKSVADARVAVLKVRWAAIEAQARAAVGAP